MHSRPIEKDRPMDGPGNNGLRGKKLYMNSRTVVGPWLEKWGSLENFNRGFTSFDFETELESVDRRSGRDMGIGKRYGAGITDLNSNDRKTTVTDSFKSREDSQANSKYLTTTQLIGKHNWKEQYEEKIVSAIPNKNDILRQYRTEFTDEDVRIRATRFQTENRRAQDFVSPVFRVEPTKLLPGTPKPVEILRRRILEKYGILGISAVRTLCCKQNKSLVSSQSFQLMLQELGVVVSKTEFLQFVVSISGRIDAFDESLPRKHYMKYFQSCPVEAGELKSRLKYNSSWPDIACELTQYLQCYTNTDNRIGLADFIQMYRDFYSSDRINFVKFVDKLWE